MDMVFAHLFPIQIIAAALPAAIMMIFGCRWAVHHSHVRARIAERCARIVERRG